jgi:hypothetical protein
MWPTSSTAPEGVARTLYWLPLPTLVRRAREQQTAQQQWFVAWNLRSVRHPRSALGNSRWRPISSCARISRFGCPTSGARQRCPTAVRTSATEVSWRRVGIFVDESLSTPTNLHGRPRHARKA